MKKNIIKKIFNVFGIEVSRFHPQEKESYALTVGNPIEFNGKENLELLYRDKENLKHHQFSESRINFCREILNQLKPHNVTLEGKSIADVGCGTGQLLRLISDTYKTTQLAGYEYSEEALKIARGLVPGAGFFSYDIYNRCAEKFDVVFCSEVLEHLLYPWKALENLSAMLRSGGVLIITVPNGRLDQWEGHINFWSPESWKSFLENHLPVTEYEVQSSSFDSASLIAIIKKIN